VRHVNLCFHGIGTPGRELEPGEEDYWISQETFLAVLDDVAQHRDVVLSFDDGNASDVEIGLPALVERDLRATFFVLAGRLDAPGCLSSADLGTLLDQGMSVGNHGMDHISWRGMDERTAERELAHARDRLAEVTGRRVDRAAAPFGLYDRRALAQLRARGYTEVNTSDRRWARAGAWLQPRFSLRRGDTPAEVRTQVLTPPSFVRRAERELVGIVKRLR